MNAIRHSMFLARRHLLHHRQRSALLIAALFIVGFLPVAVENLVQLGYKKILLKSDQEPALLALLREVKTASGIDVVIPENSPVGESQSNGTIERAVQSI